MYYVLLLMYANMYCTQTSILLNVNVRQYVLLPMMSTGTYWLGVINWLHTGLERLGWPIANQHCIYDMYCAEVSKIHVFWIIFIMYYASLR